ncbi:formate dehydrogenase subunit delta [Acidisphaera sp. L21]|uniref:formate dehydrogenase subunit delta n=1 Tax=Acidisphaera sp. L21 TaxID=1641851 RepID=UPI0020B14BA4|nr:formate dehydrogenase subunit delta [Acidisphaera sp. L21]
MQPEKLTSMANQIASFFRSYPAAEAAPGIKHHLVAFWTPAMIHTLETHIATGAEGVDELVVRALEHAPA